MATPKRTQVEHVDVLAFRNAEPQPLALLKITWPKGAGYDVVSVAAIRADIEGLRGPGRRMTLTLDCVLEERGRVTTRSQHARGVK